MTGCWAESFNVSLWAHGRPQDFFQGGQIRGLGLSSPRRVHKQSPDGGLGRSPQKPTNVLKIIGLQNILLSLLMHQNTLQFFQGGGGWVPPLPIPAGAHVWASIIQADSWSCLLSLPWQRFQAVCSATKNVYVAKRFFSSATSSWPRTCSPLLIFPKTAPFPPRIFSLFELQCNTALPSQQQLSSCFKRSEVRQKRTTILRWFLQNVYDRCRHRCRHTGMGDWLDSII